MKTTKKSVGLITGLLIGRGKKKSNFAGFLGTKLRKNWRILREISGQTWPESNWSKKGGFCGYFQARNRFSRFRGHHLLFQQQYAPEMNQWQSL